MANHIERLHSMLLNGLAFPGRAARLAAVRFAVRSTIVKGCRKVALLAVRKIEHVNNCSYVLFLPENNTLSSPEDRYYLLRGLFFGEDRCYLLGG